ncbi:MAG TPA: transketolase C-terminal domain-containing protein, partial [Urbifossiella sp.]
AKGGFRPIVYGLSAFVPLRVLEQIKIDVCYEDLPVIFVGDGAGFVYSHLGTSHQSTEDVAALRALPGLVILSPADAAETTACLPLALSLNRPVYLRLGKADLGAVHKSPPDVRLGGLCPVRSGDGSLAWIATGAMVQTALAVAERWPGSSVWSAPCLKPLDEEVIAEICRAHRAVVVVEEHSVFGGLGGAVAEIAGSQAPAWICRVGVRDRFSRCCGTYAYLLREHELDVKSVAGRVEEFLRRLPASREMPFPARAA